MSLSFGLISFAAGFIFFAIVKKYYQPMIILSEASLSMLDSLLLPEKDETKVSKVEVGLKKLLKGLSLFFLLIIAAVALAASVIFIYSVVLEISWADLPMNSPYFLLAISLGSLIPFINFKKKEKLAYSEISKLFHRIFLNNYQISKKVFKWEIKKYGAADADLRNDFVVVSGLARAGTTALMLEMNKTNQFASLDYSNMPLILAPNLWKKIYNPKTKKTKERAHGDGIQVGLNSAEALEEFFFKAKLEDSFVHKDSLEVHEISAEDYREYLKYQSVLMRNKGQRYLAKNNNLLLRYASLRKHSQNFVSIFMFREPLQHAYSLLNQHRRYLAQQEEDPFTLEYMNWLGHHEFGHGQKHFKFDQKQTNSFDKDSIDFWLEVWLNYYSYLQSQLPKAKVYLVHYQDFCEKPAVIVGGLLLGMGIDYKANPLSPFDSNKEVKEPYSKELYSSCNELYGSLLDFRFNP